MHSIYITYDSGFSDAVIARAIKANRNQKTLDSMTDGDRRDFKYARWLVGRQYMEVHSDISHEERIASRNAAALSQ